MDKLLLTLTLVAFSSGLPSNTGQNLTDNADSTLDLMDISDNTKHNSAFAGCVPTQTNLHSDLVQHFNGVNVCYPSNHLPNGYVASPRMGAHKVHKHQVNWNKARKYCKAEGGYLAILNWDTEAAILSDWLRRENISWAWIGIHNYFGDNEWLTVAGELLAGTGYNIWHVGQPDNLTTENCLVLGKEAGFADARCEWLHNYICKINIC